MPPSYSHYRLKFSLIILHEFWAQIQVHEVILEDSDVAKALSEYVKNNSIETLVIGSSPKNGFVR